MVGAAGSVGTAATATAGAANAAGAPGVDASGTVDVGGVDAMLECEASPQLGAEY